MENMFILRRVRRSPSRLATYLLFVPMIFGCQKRSSTEEVDPENITMLTVQVGINENSLTDAEPIARASAEFHKAGLSKSVNNSMNDAISQEYVEGKAFDAITSVLPEQATESGLPALASAKRINDSKAVVSKPMPVGVKFRLVLYKIGAQGEVFWRQKMLRSSTSSSSDTTQQIDVVRGDTYRWVAYSYNSTADIPPLTDLSSNADVTTGENSEFIYATGRVTISTAGVHPLRINFNHKVARLAVEVDTRGLFADSIRDLNVSIVNPSQLGFTTGRFRLRDSAIISSQAYTLPAQFSLSRFKNAADNALNRKVLYLYSATPVNVNAVGVQLRSITTWMEDANITRIFSNVNQTFSFPNVQLNSGQTYNAKIDLIESALRIGNVAWARSNLYYKSTPQGVPISNEPHRFRSTTRHDDSRESFFPFRSNSPFWYGVNDDPCSQVYPTSRPRDGLSIWRQANINDFNTLGASPVALTTTPSSLATYHVVPQSSLGYLEYTAEGTVDPYGTNRLRFNMNGYGTQIELLGQLVRIQGTPIGRGTQVYLWSNSRVIEGSLLDLGAYYYNAYRVASSLVYGPHNNVSPNAISLLSIGALGGSLIQSWFMNVRCVRREAPTI